MPALELQEPDQRAHRHRLFDQGGEQLGGGDRDVDPPALVEEPLVLRVVHPGHHPGHGELLLGQERDDQVVLVVAGGRHHHVDGGQAGRVEGGHLAGVGGHPGDVELARRRSTSSGSCSRTSTSWPLACRSRAMAVPTLPAPAMATLTSAGLVAGGGGRGPRLSRSSRSPRASAMTARWSRSPSWPTSWRPSRRGSPARVTATRLNRPGLLHVGQPAAGPALGQRPLDQDQLAGGVGPLPGDQLGEEPAADLVDGPGDGGHGGDAEALVDLGPAGVVDAGHHPGDLVGLPGDPHGQDVGVVAAGDGGQGVGPDGPGPLEVVAVETRAHHLPPAPAGGSRRKALAERSMTATEWPSRTRDMASPEPTRPHPTTTTCIPTVQHGAAWAVKKAPTAGGAGRPGRHGRTVWPWNRGPRRARGPARPGGGCGLTGVDRPSASRGRARFPDGGSAPPDLPRPAPPVATVVSESA